MKLLINSELLNVICMVGIGYIDKDIKHDFKQTNKILDDGKIRVMF